MSSSDTITASKGWVIMIKTIIFDLDDTLLWDKKSVAVAFQKTCEYAAEKVQLNPLELEENVRAEAVKLYSSYASYEFTKKIGINPFEGLWGSFDDEGDAFQLMKSIVPNYRIESWSKGLQQTGVTNPDLGRELAELFIVARRNSPFIYEETFSVLNRLKGNYKLVLLTNGSPSLQNEKLKITPEIAPYFDHIIISGAFGKGKPAREIFEHVLEKSTIVAEEALMVGDNLLTDIMGASSVGMKSVWINRELAKNKAQVMPTYEIDNLELIFDILEVNAEREVLK